ncbi:Fe-S-containing protein [Campylobacter sp. MIT 21-1685]|uniref:Fe-S-containing protein n=1 Tax=unclassified Campylobacter TaxID=2593542 RepID=UPI00224B25CE|nr:MULTISPECIES: Fe-S-containing protein [unclassified Campylobacter]MCX2682600.1 Fe-S-containing protein [Campylobacter sp. MIT 21-1684]MCX2750880.1 Fe-S-containing protein [Campylobacter sp. MIT 21-1682]MCX2807187.1 Fe-S-containing protein [Campylobacter sp. MIT 21-1685]
MSIYFVHFLSSFLPLTVFTAFLRQQKSIAKTFLAVFLGFLFAYFAFFIAAQYLQTQNLIFNVNFLFLGLLLFSFLFYFWHKIEILSLIFVAALSFCFANFYLFLSQDFPLFNNSLLDTQNISSLAFFVLALLLCIVLFFFLAWQSKINVKSSFLFYLLIFLYEANKAFSSIMLTLMRENIINTYEILLSYVAKSVYLNTYSTYFFFVYIFFLIFLSLKTVPKNRSKQFILDIQFRVQNAQAYLIKNYCGGAFIACILSIFIFAYFHNVSSKPLKIDPPTEIIPNEQGQFVFNIELLRDNKLHRFAYITNEGKVVRFFLMNKREDRDSPVAVFDACMICGDMGYIKKDSELICISCNVRIFLPSVGKAGGCNPIPLSYIYDGKTVSVNVKDVVAGSNYFNEIKEKEVQDPVSNEKLINLQAPFSYTYKGITYYFSNEKNYEIFKKEPQKFVSEEAQFLIQRRNDVG